MNDSLKRQQDAKKNEIDSTMTRADLVKGAIQIENYAGVEYGVDNDFVLDLLLYDTILLQYADGDAKEKVIGGIVVPTGITDKKLWRIGKVILAGVGCTTIKAGDYVTFPNDKGIETKSVNVEGHGLIDRCIFIAEDRLFGRMRKS